MADTPPTASIRHVLFDADGVLQEGPQSWQALARRHVGDRSEQFLRDVFADERPTLAGEGDLMTLLAARLVEYGVDAPAAEVFADVWLQIVPSAESFALVRALRERGYGVHIGTNQDRHRGTWMRTELGYDAHFDVGCWSYELGHAKPSEDYFTAAAGRIAAPSESILFIDDREDNVAAARRTGMVGIVWDLGQGHSVLVERLAAVGVDPGSSTSIRDR